MGWNIDQGIDVTSAFQGITTPLRELFDEVHQRGWDVSKVDIKDGQYAATCKNPHGEKVEKLGPTPETAVAHCLVGIMRQETMRFQPRMAAWQHTWEDQLADIAKAYADAPVYDPKAASAWKELADDSVRRAQEIANQLRVEYTHHPFPYKDVNEMAEDIAKKQKIQISKADLSHPLWSNDQVLAYRLVHDVLGHAMVGGDWGWHGENGATAAHMPLISPQAQRALFTEAIGQTAHNHFYRQRGPQKVAFLDDYLEPAQHAENAPGHGGTHPSQIVIPRNIPAIPMEEEIGKSSAMICPHCYSSDLGTDSSGGLYCRDCFWEESVHIAEPLGKNSRTSSRQPWSWGNWGKGFIDSRTGELVTWNTSPPRSLSLPQDAGIGEPHHTDVIEERGGQWTDFTSPITIAPNGSYVSSNELNTSGEEIQDPPDGREHEFQQVHKALRLTPIDVWLKQNVGGGQMGHGPKLATEGIEPWSWGNWGKGFVDAKTNEAVTWNTRLGEGDNPTVGSPHHTEVAAQRAGLSINDLQYDPDIQADLYHSPITIAPNGSYTTSNGLNARELPDGWEHRFQEEYTSLRYQPDVDQWKTMNQGGESFGHGPHMATATQGVDPNHQWESGIEPLPDNAYLWQREQSGTDPLDYQGLKDHAYKLDTGWFGLKHHDGSPDLGAQGQAVMNALRAVLLQPRKSPRWGATHYQHIQGIPATVTDPLRYADALDAQREAHNQARGLPEGIHRQSWVSQLVALKQWIKGLYSNLNDTKVEERARRELFHMIAEEEERIAAEDPSHQLSTMEVSKAVNDAIKKRLTVALKPRVDQKFDFGSQRLYHEAFNAPDPGVYGEFLHSHLRPISGLALHADHILSAARDDVTHHGGKGHHFRAQVTNLVPGVGPKEASLAWLLLQPHTSDLAVIDPSIAEALGHPPEEVANRDYFKLERQLAAGRDGAGYTHVPLGQFGWGLGDYKAYGHGQHRDLQPLRPINPTPYDQIDWMNYPSAPTAEWDDPYWWKSTQEVRDEIGKQWDRAVAVNHPRDHIPLRTAKTTSVRIPWIIHHETGEVIDGIPEISLMQHAKGSLGLTTEEIWALDPEAGKR